MTPLRVVHITNILSTVCEILNMQGYQSRSVFKIKCFSVHKTCIQLWRSLKCCKFSIHLFIHFLMISSRNHVLRLGGDDSHTDCITVTEDMLDGFRKCSFHRPTISPVRVSSSAPLLNTVWATPCFLLQNFCRNFLEANSKSFSIASSNSSHTQVGVFALVTQPFWPTRTYLLLQETP